MQFPVAEQILGLEQMHEDDMRRNLLDSSEVVREDTNQDTTNLRPSWVSLFFCCFVFCFVYHFDVRCQCCLCKNI